MNTQERQGLDLDDLGLDEFAPRTPANAPKPTKAQVSKVAQAPSREAARDGQINIKSPDAAIIERFKKICKDDRRAYYDMLQILMDNYENAQG